MRLFPISVLLLLSGGALAIGGDPSWAGVPIAVFAATTGILGLLERDKNVSPEHPRWLVLALCLFLTAIAIQVVPLPRSIVTLLSPSHDVAEFDRLRATADRRDPELVPIVSPGASRPLSISPARTWWGLGFAAALAIYVVGASSGFSATALPRLTPVLVLLGVLVTFLGIYQRSSGTSMVYGLYAPIERQTYSAPFINRNHQAGWLVMVLSITLGSFAGEVARSMRRVAPRWRDRLIWFSSNQANFVVLLLFAALIMAIGILTTLSRSGTVSLLLALALLVLLVGRRETSNVRRGTAALSLLAIALIALFTSGSAVMLRFATVSASGEDRLAIWRDSWHILRDFWFTGTGFNTYGIAMLHYQTVADGFRYIEAHNDYLQLAIEGGLLVGVPALILVTAGAIEIRRRFREGLDDTRTYWLRIGAVTGMLAIACQSLVEFTLQMPGAAVMFATLLAIAIHHPCRRTTIQERNGE